jgi:SNF2 family DNA or RNA helicase
MKWDSGELGHNADNLPLSFALAQLTELNYIDASNRKTIQTATYVNQVAKQLHTRGPFLIIAPLSTIPHWYREFTGWTDLNTIVYHGSANDRERAREDEFAFPEDRVQASNVGLRQRYLSKVAKRWRSTLSSSPGRQSRYVM